MMDEKTPLVQDDGRPNVGASESDNQVFHSVGIEPVLPDVAAGGHRTINCQVCQHIVSLEGKQNQLVVKCQDCGEATPVKAAPPGKKYVRCPCNCLLICKSGSSRVGCPRDNCKRVITLSAPAGGSLHSLTSASSLMGGPGAVPSVDITCAICGSPFILTTHERSSAARCPHCHQISSVGPTYSRIRWMVFLLASLVCLGIGVGVTIGTMALAKQYGGIYVVWVGFYLLSIGFLIRSIMYACMPVSNVVIHNAEA